MSVDAPVPVPYSAPEWDVFIAYPVGDRGLAVRIAEVLRPHVSVFLDVDQVRPGDDWDAVLHKAIQVCPIVIVLVTPASNKTFFLRDEVLRALDRVRSQPDGVVVIPVYSNGVMPDDPRVPYGLRPKQGVMVASDADLPLVQDAVVRRLNEMASRDVEPQGFSESIRAHMARLHCDVAALTQDQYRVIQYMRPMRRVRVSGCAGSGKTLVAAEKTLRLAEAGLRVLFLCHNPLLAQHIAGLVGHSSARVRDFLSWLAHIGGDQSAPPIHWTHFAEPTGEQLNAARLALQQREHYDAVVVDEAQDFRDEWWPLIEEALHSRSGGHLYIFHDNNQSLLPHRGQYPIDEPHLDLSRNCRNSGRVFELMRFYDGSAPEPERRLVGTGRVTLTVYRPGDEAKQVSHLLRGALRETGLESVAVLWAGSESTLECPLANLTVTLSMTSSWQQEVRQQFRNAPFTVPRVGLAPASRDWSWVEERLQDLTSGPYPNTQDVELVRSVAESVSVGIEAHPTLSKPTPARFRWTVADDRLFLLRRGTSIGYQGEVILFFRRSDWHRGIPRPDLRQIVPFHLPQSSTSIPLYTVSDYKGLEADVIVLVMRGRTLSHRQATYVGVSRARMILLVLADDVALAELPRGFRWDNEPSCA